MMWRSGYLTDALDRAGEHAPTGECEWCARSVPQVELQFLAVASEPCPEDVLVLCAACHPDRDPDRSKQAVIP